MALGKPDAGKPLVRFDEGRSQTVIGLAPLNPSAPPTLLRRRLPVTLFGEPTWIATAEDVILHKLVWNRLTPSGRQLGDAAGVVAVQVEALDVHYLRQWAQVPKLATELERLLSGEIKPKQT